MMSHSYFQGEADQTFQIEKTWIENELWQNLESTQKVLTGKINIIPSIGYNGLRHEYEAYEATASLKIAFTLYFRIDLTNITH